MSDEQKHTHTLCIEGCDSARAGVFTRCGQPPVIVYDYELLVLAFEKRGMTDDEAREWISVNIEGAWVGEGTPAVLHPITEHDDDEEETR